LILTKGSILILKTTPKVVYNNLRSKIGTPQEYSQNEKDGGQAFIAAEKANISIP